MKYPQYPPPPDPFLQMPVPDPTYKAPVFPLYGPRSQPLIISGHLFEGLVTVELYVKWYGLVIVRKVLYDEVILEEVPFPDDEYCVAGESPYSDHAPNPTVVARWAAKHGYSVDEVAMEVMIGRWERESRNNYGATYWDLPEAPKPPCTICGGKGFVEVAERTDPVLGQAINPCKCRLKED